MADTEVRQCNFIFLHFIAAILNCIFCIVFIFLNCIFQLLRDLLNRALKENVVERLELFQTITNKLTNPGEYKKSFSLF